MAFKDYFSDHAAGYASYRPNYPAALFSWLADQCVQHRNAWDCATGSGQAAVALAPYFQSVIATDASHAQLIQATQHDNISYVCAGAENVPLASDSLDLITVAQAAHWFDRPRFYREVERLLVSDGILALWCYGLFQITPQIDTLIHDYYQHTVGGHWPPERRHIEQAYRQIGFPYAERSVPAFNMQIDWNLSQVMGYLATWSATRLYIKVTGSDPLPALEQQLTEMWGDTEQPRSIHWPLHLKVGSKP
jgi:SAM-dependent methyltransferase